MVTKQGTSPKTKRANGARKSETAKAGARKLPTNSSTPVAKKAQVTNLGVSSIEHKPVAKADTQVIFRREQASMATRHDWVRDINPSSPVFDMVIGAIEAFPTVRVTGTCNRTNMAINKAFRQMKGDQLKVLCANDNRLLNHAKCVIRKSLKWAFDEVKAGNTGTDTTSKPVVSPTPAAVFGQPKPSGLKDWANQQQANQPTPELVSA